MDPKKTIKEIRSLKNLESLLPKFLLNPVMICHIAHSLENVTLITGLTRIIHAKREMKVC